MTARTQSWSAQHFSLANPKGPHQADVPALLRRLADAIQECGAVEVQDIAFHMEIDEEGACRPTATVYFHVLPLRDGRGVSTPPPTSGAR